MEAFFVSVAIVALAEIGDKTQLLALVLAARFRRPVPIVLGIATATLANHTAAAALGAWIATVLGPARLRLILGVSFVAMALWTLVPDRPPRRREHPSRFGVFGTTVVAFFLLEMGDKTQIATAALAARYATLLPVVAGTTCGMLLADVPAVLLGEAAAKRVSLRLLRAVGAVVFALMGAWLVWAGASQEPSGSR
jgi:putative Ca2+/H+ antiporter (TMEM165/GDT1 family)